MTGRKFLFESHWFIVYILFIILKYILQKLDYVFFNIILWLLILCYFFFVFSFNSAKAAPLIFADQYIQIGTVLSSKYLYGLGEHQDKFLIDINWTSRGFWARDQAPRVSHNGSQRSNSNKWLLILSHDEFMHFVCVNLFWNVTILMTMISINTLSISLCYKNCGI